MTRFLVLTVLALLAAACSREHAHETPAEQAIEYRHSLYHVISWNVHAMNDMVEQKASFDSSKFARNAERVAYLVPMLPEGFTPDSYLAGKTDAKPEIWKNREDFDAKLKKFATDSAALAELAKNSTLEQLTPAFKELKGDCKSCHDKYRAED
jgi:cytochrome c556